MTNVLLVEDNPIDARLMQRMFQELVDWPTQVRWVDDGQKALWYLESLEDGEGDDLPDVVLLDVNLPKYDGIQVLEAYRNSPVFCETPVFLYSSSPAKDLAELAERHNLQANGYFEKPFGLEGYMEIATNLKNYLENSTRSMERLARVTSEARTAVEPGQTRSAHT